MKLVTLVVSLLVAVGSAWAQLGIDEGFEGALPDFHTYQATYAADTARAHGGAQSLRVTPSGRTCTACSACMRIALSGRCGR
ncbi:MAG: hypothetical protein A3K19_21360 [Lentisphaerae bacterium RIFOXYB12_FULL_65_16]|nr:MAG: hypothetical protein A3K18_34035 [Lentisphaerae bacterium RIFOXYA12_64_32]OGV93681.1 MAG: hypothetical protein A3K19_21360 [Lentisphaerae bacterium RIFOXYB12_FULL_65_16]